MTAIILSGGKSSRFGKDKAFVTVKAVTIFERQLNVLKKIFRKIIIVTDNPQKFRPYKNLIRRVCKNASKGNNLKEIRIIKDILPERGPLCGILSGLIKSRSRHNFVVACDMPFLNEQLIGYMIKNIKNFDIFIPKIYTKFHPLCGIYSKNCISVIRRLVLQDRLKVSDIFSNPATRVPWRIGTSPQDRRSKFRSRGFHPRGSRLKVKFISNKKLQSFDKDLLCLENINTLQDLKNINKKRRYV